MANEPSTDLPTAREAASSSEACQEKEQAPSQAPEEEPVETREATQDPVREGPPLARMGLTKRDVLLGRGKGTTQHDGNVRYLKIIDEFAPIYQKLSTRQDQLAVKVDVVKAVHEYGGRFMQHVDGSKTEFCEAPMQVIMKKIGQSLRHCIRKESLPPPPKKPKKTSEESHKVEGYQKLEGYRTHPMATSKPDTPRDPPSQLYANLLRLEQQFLPPVIPPIAPLVAQAPRPVRAPPPAQVQRPPLVIVYPSAQAMARNAASLKNLSFSAALALIQARQQRGQKPGQFGWKEF